MEEIDIFSDDWFERLADITECPPATLRDRIPDTSFVDYVAARDAKTRAKHGWKRPRGAAERDILWFVTPVPQKDSGVMRYIE